MTHDSLSSSCCAWSSSSTFFFNFQASLRQVQTRGDRKMMACDPAAAAEKARVLCFCNHETVFMNFHLLFWLFMPIF